MGRVYLKKGFHQGNLTQNLTIYKTNHEKVTIKITEEVMDQIVRFGTYAICILTNAAGI